MTEKVGNDDSWDGMIFRFIKDRKDWLSKNILRNRLEQQTKSAQKEVKVKDNTDSKIWENLHPGNQVSTQNPPPIEVWFTNRMSKPKNPPLRSDIKSPMKNSDDENDPNGRKNSGEKLPTTPPTSAKKVQSWRGITIESTWYDTLKNTSKEHDTEISDHNEPIDDLKEIPNDTGTE